MRRRYVIVLLNRKAILAFHSDCLRGIHYFETHLTLNPIEKALLSANGAE
jgi:hypothetical protein